jgi:hypothetical protein
MQLYSCRATGSDRGWQRWVTSSHVSIANTLGFLIGHDTIGRDHVTRRHSFVLSSTARSRTDATVDFFATEICVQTKSHALIPSTKYVYKRLLKNDFRTKSTT